MNEAWLYTLIPAVAAVAGAIVAVKVRPGPTLVSAVQYVAAGGGPRSGGGRDPREILVARHLRRIQNLGPIATEPTTD